MTHRRVIVYSGPEASARVASDTLGEAFELVVVPPEPDAVREAFVGCDAFIDASMRVPIGADLIESAPNLELVVTATTGASHIDAAALEARGVPLLTLKGQTELLRGITPAAELSWLLLMACARHLRAAVRHVDAGEWDRTLFPGTMLRGKTVGLIGLGRIGGWMARYALAFDMTVLAHDPYVAEAPEGVELVGLDDLLARADFVSLHVHLSEETRGVLDAARIGMLKVGSVVVNTSRGELIDEGALVEALESGRVAAVGADVLAREPDAGSSPLWRYAKTHDNVIITPHIGGFAPEAVDIVVAFSAQRVRDHFEGKR